MSEMSKDQGIKQKESRAAQRQQRPGNHPTCYTICARLHWQNGNIEKQ